MTDNLFFDTDCLSSFLWVGREDIILRRYQNRIIIPQFVYEELCYPGVQNLRKIVDNMIVSKLINRMQIDYGTEEARLFRELTKLPRPGNAIIGKGEASAIVLAKKHAGKVASNNLRDVKIYVNEFNLELITTADILVKEFTDGNLSETDANQVWQNMLKKQRKLPATSFSEYLRRL